MAYVTRLGNKSLYLRSDLWACISSRGRLLASSEDKEVVDRVLQEIFDDVRCSVCGQFYTQCSSTAAERAMGDFSCEFNDIPF
jgi:hypothetical protein